MSVTCRICWVLWGITGECRRPGYHDVPKETR